MSKLRAQNIMTMVGHREGEPSAEKPGMRRLFDEEESGALKFAYGLLGRRELAEEVVQDAFLALFENYEEVENPKAWLYRSVRNMALNVMRKRKREVEGWEGDREDEREAPDEVLGKVEAAGQLRLLLAELKPAERELVRLKYEEDLCYKEIAASLKTSVGNVGYRLHHVLKGLADGLRKVGVEGSQR